MEKVEMSPEVKVQKGRRAVGGWKKMKAKALSAYYGRPIEDLKLVVVVGEQRELVTKMMAVMLRFLGQKTEGMVENRGLKPAVLHKFLSDAWKKGAGYVVVGMPRGRDFGELEELLIGVPLEAIILTDYVSDDIAVDFLEFCRMKRGEDAKKPNNLRVVMARDVGNFDKVDSLLEEFLGLSFGRERGASVRVSNVKGYPKGTEAMVAYGSEVFTVATLATGEEMAEVLGAVVAGGYVLGFGTEEVVEGVGEWGF